MEAKPLQVTQEATNAPSKPQTTPKATGQVLIMSATPGVSVYLKGRLLGRTPLRVQLPVGTAHLSIQPSAKSPRSTVSTKVNAGRVNVLTLK
jgi:hypothetical protein